MTSVAAYTGPERRQHARHEVASRFWLLTDNGTSLLMTSVNVSRGGAYLAVEPRHEELPAVGTSVRFTIAARDDGIVPDDVKTAEVVRVAMDGLAIRFLG